MLQEQEQSARAGCSSLQEGKSENARKAKKARETLSLGQGGKERAGKAREAGLTARKVKKLS